MYSYKCTFYQNITWWVIFYSAFSSCINTSWAIFTYPCRSIRSLLMYLVLNSIIWLSQNSSQFLLLGHLRNFQVFLNFLLWHLYTYMSGCFLDYLLKMELLHQRICQIFSFWWRSANCLPKSLFILSNLLCSIKNFFPITKLIDSNYREHADKQIKELQGSYHSNLQLCNPLRWIRY